MGNDKEVILTIDGLSKLEKELEHLKTVRRREVAERIKQALEFGDISENSEYEDAKNEQGFIEGRVLSIEKMLRNARVIDENEEHSGIVTVGSTVKIVEVNGGAEVEYTFVGSAEADPVKYRISNESPVGSALMGKKKGSVVEVAVPDGMLKFKILQIYK